MTDPTVDDPGGTDLLRLFQRACALDGDERERMLAELEERDAGLASELRELLAADEGEGAVPQQPTSAPIAKDELGDAATSSGVHEERLREEIAALAAQTRGVNRYRVGNELGEGGMGRVHRVVDRPLRRELAMKTIRRSDDRAPEPTLLARFLTEARILGKLDHPGIVSIHELGVDADGDVYFTMPVVQGGDLRRAFAKSRRNEDGWTLARAVGVLQRVCEAMAHAHANSVVHRDLKPSNVMVGRFGEVQVMDWGVARVRGERDQRDLRPRPVDSEATASQSPVRTMDGAVVGTPYFMSPEQGLGRSDEVDERSDVYAVGAMLYELLGARRPYEEPDGDNAPYAVMARLFERDPEPLASIAPESPTELVAICEKAMARDRARRYAGMEDLAGDLRAFLEDRVVRAYETGTWAEARKWIRRNRGVAAATMGVVAVAFLGLGGTSYVQARVNERLAHQVEITEAVNEFLNDDLLAAVAPGYETAWTNRDAPLHEILDVAAARLEAGSASGRKFADKPLVEAAVRQSLGDSYLKLGEYSKALAHLERALAVRSEKLGPDDPGTIAAAVGVARASFNLSHVNEAEELLLQSLEASERVNGHDDPDTLRIVNNLAILYQSRGDYDAAEQFYVRSAGVSRRTLGEDASETITARFGLAALARSRGNFDEAEAILTDLLERSRRARGEDHAQTMFLTAGLGRLFDLQGRHDEAATYKLAALERRRAVLGDQHPDTISSMNSMAWFLLTREPEESRDPARALSLASLADELRPGDPAILDTLAMACERTGDLRRALATQEKAVAALAGGPALSSETRRELTERLERYRRMAEGTPSDEE